MLAEEDQHVAGAQMPPRTASGKDHVVGWWKSRPPNATAEGTPSPTRSGPTTRFTTGPDIAFCERLRFVRDLVLAGPTLLHTKFSLFFGCRGRMLGAVDPRAGHPRLYLSWPVTALSTPVMSDAPRRSRAQRLELRGSGLQGAEAAGQDIDKSGSACRGE